MNQNNNTGISESRVNICEDGEVSYKEDNKAVWLTGMTIALAEFVGTALLVFATCMGCTKGYAGAGGDIPILQLGLASGLSVTTVIQIFGHISGAHVNPAITICAVIMGEISLKSAPIYVTSQIAGSLTGYALLVALAPDKDLPYGHCVNSPHEDISLLQACSVEVIATIILALAVCASWDPKNSDNDSVPLKIGIIVVLLNISAGHYTGASMNPARSFGPALWNRKWTGHWIYWVGPIVGASLTGQVYKKLFL